MHNNRKNLSNNKTNEDYWIYGRHSVEAAIINPKRKIHKIIIHEKNNHKISGNIKTEIKIVDGKYFDNLLGSEINHQGIAALISPIKINIEEIIKYDKKGKRILVILDHVTDPHNIGAILRSSAAFSAEAVITTINSAPPENATISKVSVGAIEKIPYIRVTNLARTIEYLKENGYWTIGLDGSADKELTKTPNYEKIILIFGSEEKGIRELTKKNCDIFAKLTIKNIESLNVSNAASIALYIETAIKI